MLRPGERIGDWIVEARLGEGEHGAIFLARHGLNLNLRGALKVARPPDYEKARNNFIAEIEPLLMLRHEALIHVLGWGEDPERNLLWMTTELVRGQSLEQRLGDGPFELEELGFVFGRLAGALALIHSHGAHHGDLRPSDVLLAEGRHIRITGFGTVFREGSQGQLDAESLAYVGPEYFDDPEGCSPVQADIYAIGLILHEAITGVRVFPVDPTLKPAPQMARIMGMKMRMGPLDPGEDVPLPLRRIVLQTTDPDPQARPPDLSGFLTALSMATRDRDDMAPRVVATDAGDAAAPSDVPEPGASPESFGVRLESSVLGQQQRPTPFPFAPPGWGPRAHQVPSPLAGILRDEPQLDAPEPGVVRELEVAERDVASPAPPVADAPVSFDEPAAVEPPVIVPVEPVAPPEPEPEPQPEPEPEPEPEPIPPVEEDEPEEATLVEEQEEEAVLVDPVHAAVPEHSWDRDDGPAAPEPPVADGEDIAAGRQRQRRAFVPPPPVPDPTLVAPSPLAPGEPEPVAPSTEPEAAHLSAPEPAAVEPVPAPEPRSAPTLVPPAPAVLVPEPTPVAPSEPPLAEAGPTLLPPDEPPPEEPPASSDEPVPMPADVDVTQAPQPEAVAAVAAVGAVGAVGAASLADAHHTHVPEEHHTHVPDEDLAPAAQLPEPSPEPEAAAAPEPSPEPAPAVDSLDDDEDWSWHDEGGELDSDFAIEPEEPSSLDPYTRPIDQLYADDLDPSASDIAADVFGEHAEGAAWLKWVLPAVIVICVLVFVFAFWNREQPTVEQPQPEGATPSSAEAPSSPPPAPVEPPPPLEPELEETVQEPAIDLEAVVAGDAPADAADAPEAAPEPAPEPRSTSRSGSSSSRSSSSRGSSSSRSATPAPVVTAPAPEPEPVVAGAEPEPVLPAEPEPAPTKGVMDYLRDGWSSLDSGNLVGAQGAFMAALSMDSGNGMAHYGLGQVAERARDYGGSAYHYGRALSVLGGNPTMKGELEAALRRVNAKTGAAAPAAQPTAQPAPAEEAAPEVTRKKRDELEESFRQELWDEDDSN